VNELRERLAELELPEDVRKAAERELSRLEKLPPAAAEYGVIRTYLDWILTLPWDKTTEDTSTSSRPGTILDKDHFDLEKVKDRIIEYLAVSKLKGDVRARSSASSARRESARPRSASRSRARSGEVRRASRSAASRRGGDPRPPAHRTSARCPGTIIRALRDAESKNPVFLIDEIDKMGSDWRGDPSSAMLEVLDPEQNSSFRDHYLDLPFDLSKVLFICTANQLETIPGPLLDRMDVIQLSGYTEDEKVEIAKRYLVRSSSRRTA
jgi:ATP-dependent Lon protease